VQRARVLRATIVSPTRASAPLVRPWRDDIVSPPAGAGYCVPYRFLHSATSVTCLDPLYADGIHEENLANGVLILPDHARCIVAVEIHKLPEWMANDAESRFHRTDGPCDRPRHRGPSSGRGELGCRLGPDREGCVRCGRLEDSAIRPRTQTLHSSHSDARRTSHGTTRRSGPGGRIRSRWQPYETGNGVLDISYNPSAVK